MTSGRLRRFRSAGSAATTEAGSRKILGVHPGSLQEASEACNEGFVAKRLPVQTLEQWRIPGTRKFSEKSLDGHNWTRWLPKGSGNSDCGSLVEPIAFGVREGEGDVRAVVKIWEKLHAVVDEVAVITRANGDFVGSEKARVGEAARGVECGVAGDDTWFELVEYGKEGGMGDGLSRFLEI
jgi:hypothetical protein